jgi:hypothetical protein
VVFTRRSISGLGPNGAPALRREAQAASAIWARVVVVLAQDDLAFLQRLGA